MRRPPPLTLDSLGGCCAMTTPPTPLHKGGKVGRSPLPVGQGRSHIPSPPCEAFKFPPLAKGGLEGVVTPQSPALAVRLAEEWRSLAAAPAITRPEQAPRQALGARLDSSLCVAFSFAFISRRVVAPAVAPPPTIVQGSRRGADDLARWRQTRNAQGHRTPGRSP